MQPDRVRAPSAVLALSLLACAAGCASVPAAPAPRSPASAAASVPGTLAVAGAEGRVTYSVTLRPGQCRARDHGRLPDPACTPGSVDGRVTQADIGSTVCRHGWTATVRPPSGVTDRAKYAVAYPAYGIPAGTAAELDHLVPLELGGSSDISNLWPEAGTIPNAKDAAENRLRGEVCAGRLTLARAQLAIASDWETAP